MSVAQTVISATKQQILAFNYASQALNNSFFLDNLVRILALQLHLYTDGVFRRNQTKILQTMKKISAQSSWASFTKVLTT